MNIFEKIVNWFKSWFGGEASIPKWDQCTKASCWNGANASQRMMNILSPSMSEDKFKSYMNWMKARGCNTAHVFTSNQADGENAGYCIYGNTWDWSVDSNTVNIMKKRIDELRKNDFAVVLWLFADDSRWNQKAKKNFPKHLSDLREQGILEKASTVVAGLELNEYLNASEVAALANSIRANYSGKIGIHQTSSRFDYAGLGDIMFYQINPGKPASFIKSEATRVKNATGKPLNFFEIERQPDRAKSEAAMAGGAFGVGNW